MPIGRYLIALPLVLIAVSVPAAIAQFPKTGQISCSDASSNVGGCAGASQGGVAISAASPNLRSIWGGARETIALKWDGTVWAWGLNNCGGLGSGTCGKLGDGTTYNQLTPVQVHGPGNVGYLTSITAIMGGEHANYALKSDGTVWAWGGNFVGQLGDGTFINTVTPVPVSGLTSITSLGAADITTWRLNRMARSGHGAGIAVAN